MSGLNPPANARDLLRMDSSQAGQVMRSLSIEQQRELVLAIEPGRRRQDMILLSDRPDALTRMLAPEDFLLTVKAIGDQDALTLVELSSNSQLNYLLDLDLWVRTDLDMDQLDHWMTLLMEAGPDRMMRWVDHTDFELLVLMFERWCLLVEREALVDLPDSVTARVISPDNFHHILVKVGADLDHMREIVDLLYFRDQKRFLAILGNLGTTPPAELEELTLRWRTARLADRGWPDPDEAIAIYQPLDPARLPSDAPLPQGLAGAPRYPLQQRSSGRLFPAALERLVQTEIREVLAMQLASLINRVITADGLQAAELEVLEQASQVVAGRLEIGLAQLGARDPEMAADIVAKTPLLHVAQVAQAAILTRHNRASALAAKPAADLLELLSPPLPERLVAVARPRPSFVEHPGELPRPLSGPQDLLALDRDLDLTEAALSLAATLGCSAAALPDPFPPGSFPESREGLSLEVLLLTGLARNHLGLDSALAPIPADRLGDLAAALPRDSVAQGETLRFWGGDDLQSPGAGRLVDALVELARGWVEAWDRGDYDPRFVAGFWVSAD